MPRRSLDSERPIMSPSLASKRTSVRMSTYSASPSFNTTATTSTTALADTGRAEISHITSGLDRLENKKLAEQRFTPTPKKSETLDKLALGAKVERALGRRMGNQDATMPKVGRKQKSTPIVIEGMSEKMGMERKGGLGKVQ